MLIVQLGAPYRLFCSMDRQLGADDLPSRARIEREVKMKFRPKALCNNNVDIDLLDGWRLL